MFHVVQRKKILHMAGFLFETEVAEPWKPSEMVNHGNHQRNYKGKKGYFLSKANRCRMLMHSF